MGEGPNGRWTEKKNLKVNYKNDSTAVQLKGIK